MNRYLMVMVLTCLLMFTLTGAAEELFNPGLQVNQMIPAFKNPDQQGKVQDFSSLKGAKGLALLFFRSADW